MLKNYRIVIRNHHQVNPILSTTEQLNEETGKNEIKPDKECTDDVCQLVTIEEFLSDSQYGK